MFNTIGIALLIAIILFIVDILVDIFRKLANLKSNNALRLCKNAIAITILSTLNDCLIEANKEVKNKDDENTEESK